MKSEAYEDTGTDMSNDFDSLSMETILSGENLATKLSDETLAAIGMDVVSKHDDDAQSRSEWETRMEDALNLAMQLREHKSFPWSNASNVKFPLLSIAALQFHSRVYPIMVDGINVVKVRPRGYDPDGTKAARAMRLSSHMSDQCLEDEESWEEDHDRMLMALPITGCQFTKTFPADDGIPNSEWVLAQDLVVPYRAKTLEAAPQLTHRLRLTELQIKERELDGRFLKLNYGPMPMMQQNTTSQYDERTGTMEVRAQHRMFYEQHTSWDLDGDGYAEPYIITVHAPSSEVVRIAPRFTEEGVVTDADRAIRDTKQRARKSIESMVTQAKQIMAAVQPAEADGEPAAPEAAAEARQQVDALKRTAQAMAEGVDAAAARRRKEAKLIRIKPLHYFTKYSFIPSPDGGIYDLGFGVLLGPINESINTLVNQLIDAGTLSNSNGGFIGRGARLKGGKVVMEPFKWHKVATSGNDLRGNIVPFPVNAPSPVLFSLLNLLVNYGERLTSVTDMMQGQTPGQNTPATTSMAALEQGLQVFHGIFKRVYRGFKHEFRLRFQVNARALDFSRYQDEMENAQETDYAGNGNDVAPAADPKMVTRELKVAKAQFLAARAAQVPGYDPRAVEKHLLAAMDVADTEEVYPTEPGKEIGPTPDPEMEIKKAEEQRHTLESATRAETAEREQERKDRIATADIGLKQLQAVKILSEVEDTAVRRRMEAIFKVIEAAGNAEDRDERRSEKDDRQRDTPAPSGNGGGGAGMAG